MSPVDLSEFIDEPGDSPCKMARLITALSAANKTRHDNLIGAMEAIDEVSGKYKVSNVRITKVLKDWGFAVSIFTVRVHRVNECTCA
jgi:hypothetical protein